MSVPSEFALVSSWRKITLFGGVMSIVLGLVLLLWPGKTALVLTALVGVWLLVLGCSRLGWAAAHRREERAGRGFTALAGAIYIIAGIVVLTHLHGSLHFLAVLLGVIWICAGLSEALSGYARVGGPWVRVAPILAGVVNIVLGLIVLVLPGLSLTTLSWIFALWLILLGVLQLYFAYRARQAELDLSGRPN
jgi:uncharacterized membrane protein HdeD (DUF308 family)